VSKFNTSRRNSSSCFAPAVTKDQHVWAVIRTNHDVEHWFSKMVLRFQLASERWESSSKIVSLSLVRVQTSALATVIWSRFFFFPSLSFYLNNIGADLNARAKFTAVSPGLSYMRRVSFKFAQDVLCILRGGKRGGTRDQARAKGKAFAFLLIPMRGWEDED